MANRKAMDHANDAKRFADDVLFVLGDVRENGSARDLALAALGQSLGYLALAVEELAKKQD